MAELDDRALRIEVNGINVISGTERRGRPRDLFWPWFAANVSVLAVSYGAFATFCEPPGAPRDS